jgi:ligand-binding sensor domain-containing protein
MKNYSFQVIVFFLTSLLFGIACKGPLKNDLIKDDQHPKLIKTIGDPKYGNVQCIYQDQAGILWFGTTENGLYKYDGKSFSRFLVADGLNSNNIYAILQDTVGNLWLGTEAGLCIYDGKNFTEIKIPLPKKLPPNKNPYYAQSHWVYQILQTKSGRIWIVTIDGVYVYNGQSKHAGEASFTLFPINDAANGFLTTNDKVERIFEDKEGNIWMGGRTNKGVYRFDGKSVTNFELPELIQKGPTPKPHSWAWPQMQDKNGHIWFSNWGGAYRFDGKTFSGYTTKDGLPGMVTRIIEDKKGNIWLGGDGLTRFDGKSFTAFTTKDGLTNPGVWSILEDKNGNLWVGTRGTNLYLYDGKKFIAYSEYKH